MLVEAFCYLGYEAVTIIREAYHYEAATYGDRSRYQRIIEDLEEQPLSRPRMGRKNFLLLGFSSDQNELKNILGDLRGRVSTFSKNL
jgi:hypothetical protein